MGGPCDVHDQTIRTIKSDPRAVPLRPARQGVQKLLIPDRVRRMTLQIAAKGACIRKPHARLQPVLRRPLVQAVNAFGVAVSLGQRKGGINGTRPEEPVARQPRKPQ